jgi:hypothetical protein
VITVRGEEAHLRVCILQQVICDICGSSVLRRDLENHDTKENRTHMLALQTRIRNLEEENARLKTVTLSTAPLPCCSLFTRL